MIFLITIMLTLYTIACCVLIFVILIQSGKGGGLSSLGSASHGLSEALGATGAEKTLNRLTTWCAAGFVILAMLLTLVGNRTFSAKNNTLVGSGAAAPAAQQAPIGANPGRNVPAPGPATGQAPAPAAVQPVQIPAAPANPAPAAPAPAAKAPVAPAPAAPAAPAPAK